MEQYEKIYLYRRIVRAKLFIDSCYANPISLDNISSEASFSKFHFIRLFKSIYGKTPKNYLKQIRIDRAKILLAKGHSVLETSMLVGFDSPTSFTGAFRKAVGQAPSSFQKKELVKQSRLLAAPLLFVPNCFAEAHGWTE
jgi:AraC-like DNA-binding protein